MFGLQLTEFIKLRQLYASNNNVHIKFKIYNYLVNQNSQNKDIFLKYSKKDLEIIKNINFVTYN